MQNTTVQPKLALSDTTGVTCDECGHTIFEQILLNAGETQEMINEREEYIVGGDKWVGFNPRTGKYVDMMKEGIIDPTKVTRLALENAASVAGTMLITECVIANVEDKTKQGGDVDPNMFM